MTYGQLDQRARSIAASLQSLNVHEGDRVLLLYPPGLDYVAGFFGCLYAGGIAVPAYPPGRGKNSMRLEGIINDAAPRIALTVEAVAARSGSSFSLPLLCIEQCEAGPSREWHEPTLSSQFTALLQYTSGSTSQPRGVMVTHNNLLHNQEMIREAFQQTESSTVVSWLPLYHDMGLIGGVIQPVYVGAPCILMSPESFIQRPIRWLRAITAYKATTSGGPNFGYELCVQKISDSERATLDLSTWVTAFNGSERINPATLERFAKSFGPAGFQPKSFHPCYGLAEGTLFVTGGQLDEVPRVLNVSAEDMRRNVVTTGSSAKTQPVVSCGVSFGEQAIRIVDPVSLERLGEGKIGEVWVSGPSVAAGYWNQAEETEKIFSARTPSEEGRLFLRTGDLGFQLNQQLYITGRMKEMMIFRGRNYYPQDIEETIRRCHPGLGMGAVFSLNVDGEEKLAIVQEIEGKERELDGNKILATMWAAVAEEHELQLHAAGLVKRGTIPRTTSGKIQRHNCRKLFLSGSAIWLAQKTWTGAPKSVYVAPQTTTEKMLATIVQELLGTERIGLEDDFFSLGGDSLLLTQIMSRINHSFKVEMTFANLFEARTIKELALQIESAQTRQKATSEAPIGRRKPEEPRALSFAQQRLWFLNQLHPETQAYIIRAGVRLTGTVNIAALRRALQTIVERHEVLRTRFPLIEDQPGQVVETVAEVPWHEFDVSDWPETEREAQAVSVIMRESRRPLQLATELPVRTTLLKLDQETHIFLLSVHHIVFDGWSADVLLKELEILYKAFLQDGTSPLPDLPLQYSDFAVWQKQRMQSKALERELQYWRTQLQDLPITEMPADHPRTAVSGSDSGKVKFILPPSLMKEVRELSHREDATVFMTLLATWQSLMLRYTGQTDIVVGSTVANRNRAEIENLIGFFVNTLVLRTQLDGDPTFRQVLALVRKTATEAYAHQDIPFEKLVAELHPERSFSRAPLFQVLFSFRSSRQQHVELPNVKAEFIEIPAADAAFDLSVLLVDEGDSTTATFEYCLNLFSDGYIERMGVHLLSLLRSAIDNPDKRISTLPMLAKQEQQLLECWNLTPRNYAHEECIHQLFENQVERTPSRVAVRYEGRSLTYDELNKKANSLAQYLLSIGIKPESRVGICAERSFEMVIALLGVLKAGAMFVPFDPSYPRERLNFMLEDSAVSALLIQEHLKLRLLTQPVMMISLDAEWEQIAKYSRENPCTGVFPSNAAYMIYTSGSTGRPKGVVNSHAGICNRLLWMQETVPLVENDRLLQKTPFGFDVSVGEFFWPLITGAQLIMARPEEHRDTKYLAEVIDREAITTIHFVPPMLGEFLNEPARSECKGLRRVMCSGEALPAHLVERFLQELPHVELHNLYGPTEAAIEVSHWKCCSQAGMAVPIGRPISNTELRILDVNGTAVPPGIPGELYIGGKGVARGYWQRPELTAEKFIPDVFSGRPGSRMYRTGDRAKYRLNGDIEYLGRLDHQVKLRGFRIELGEIEASIAAHPGVKESVVLLRSDSQGRQRLVAYIVSNPDIELDTGRLKSFLAERLPEYMVPSAFLTLAALPLTTNGKVDREQLPLPDDITTSSPKGGDEPQSDTEKLLLEIWQQVLGREHVGIHENFFTLGGDSILSIQVASRANRAGLRITTRDIFERQTIAQLAAVPAGNRVEADQTPILGPAPLSPMQHWFFQQNFECPEHWNQCVLLQIRKPWRYDLFQEALKGLIVHHEVLCHRFYRDQAGWRQVNAGPEATLATNHAEHVNISTVPDAERSFLIDERAAAAHSSLDLLNGPLFRAVFFEDACGRPSYLLLVAHHLVVDAVSWQVLIEDLETGYEQVSQNQSIRLPRKTLSYRQWCTLLQRQIEDSQLSDDQAYWRACYENQHPALLPVDFAGVLDDVASEYEISIGITPEETKRLLTETCIRYKATVEELLLTALTGALRRWTEQRQFVIDLERHGREEIADSADCSRTVGWFTSMFPMCFNTGISDDPIDLLRSIKEQLRRVPKRGLTYGVLRYLCADEASSSEGLKNTPIAELSFNYLGQFDRLLRGDSALSFVSEKCGTSRSPKGRRSHSLEVTARVQYGQIKVAWAFSRNKYQTATIQRLAGEFSQMLAALLLQESSAVQSYVPSDFGLPSLSPKDLQNILQSPGADGEVIDIYTATQAQQGMIFHTSYAPASGIYLMQIICTITGAFNIEAFHQAWQTTINRYDVLRTSFYTKSTGEPVQLVHRAVRPAWNHEDWQTFSEAEQKRRLEMYLEADRRRGIQLEKPPLMRLALIRTGADEYQFVWSYHHAILDGWSTALVLKGVMECYTALESGTVVSEPQIRPYRDFVTWTQKQDTAACERFWRHELAGFHTPIRLNFGALQQPETMQGGQFESRELLLDENVSLQLESLARENQLTLHTILQGAWAMLLGYYSQTEDIVFGTVSSGRPASLAGIESMAGLFVSLLPVRVHLSPSKPVQHLLVELQTRLAEMRQHECALVQIQGWAEMPAGSPLFDSILSLNNYPVDQILWRENGEARFHHLRVVDWNSYPLSVAITPGKRIHVLIKYDSQRFAGQNIAQATELYDMLLHVIPVHVSSSLAEMNQLLLGESHRQQQERAISVSSAVQKRLLQVRPRRSSSEPLVPQ